MGKKVFLEVMDFQSYFSVPVKVQKTNERGKALILILGAFINLQRRAL